MGPFLALISSLSWGLADFLGGVSSRRVGSLRVIAVSYPVGALLLTALSLTLVHGTLDGETIAWAVATGLMGIVAMGLFYRALAAGPMGIISPITAVLSAAIPVVVGIARGESLTAIAIAGMVLAGLAVVLVSREVGDHPTITRRSILLAIAAGAAIGAYLTGIGLAPTGSGIWVVTIGRWVASGAVLVTVAIVSRRGPSNAPSAPFPWAFAIGAGLLDCTANALFQLAVRMDALAIVAVIGSLYPAATVVLARYVLKERMSAVQVVGVGLALTAAAALALS